METDERPNRREKRYVNTDIWNYVSSFSLAFTQLKTKPNQTSSHVKRNHEDGTN